MRRAAARHLLRVFGSGTTFYGTVLLRAEDQVGHGARAVSRTAELAGDTLAFAARHTGLKV